MSLERVDGMVMLDIGEALEELDPVHKPANEKGQNCN